MARLGILLAQVHYPTIAPEVSHLDAQFRLMMAAQNTEITSVSVYNLYENVTPQSVSDADIWIVSGGGQIPSLNGRDTEGAAAAADRLPLYGLSHGEHLLHRALSGPGAAAPTTSCASRSTRNPFRSFWIGDTLFRFDPSSRKIRPVPRPPKLSRARMFEAALADA